MKRRNFITGLGASLALSQLGVAGAQENSASRETHGDIENIIVMLGDGMGFDPIQTTSHVHGDLAMESMTTAAMTRTFPRGGEVTGSAAAGTALATGFQAYNGQVSVRGDEGASADEVEPVTTQLEAAQELGMATGLVTTTRITHASPAVYGSHVPDRGMEGEIANQFLDHEIDVMLGAGRREWSDDQLHRAENLGYDVLHDAADLEETDADHLLGLFDESHLTYSLDRDESHPDLAQMTAAAVDRLEDDEDGFFLFVEGGRIDHAEHSNDAWTTVGETKDFDDAVQWVLDYVEDRSDTLVVVTSDHETGGMSTGNGDYGDVLDIEGLANASASSGVIAQAIADSGDVRGVINDHLDFDGELGDEELEQIAAAVEDDGGSTTIGQILSPYLGIEWPHTSHTGPGQIVLAAGPDDTTAGFDGWYHHHTDLSATLSAILLFGGVAEVPESYREQWEQNVLARGADGIRDAYITTQYLGPVGDDELLSVLDTNDDGLVDLSDVLAIYDGEGVTPDAVQSVGEGALSDVSDAADSVHQF
ncbi:alkaline phosphatase [Halobacteriaceae archaeon SHR40]|uniref:alkaline phosphatase n=1 Tax=Halovenus amylolytica TaxID=2500550 RepID=UPI000FE3C255